MVKGITRRVIVIKSPDPALFEEAIFFVKEDALRGAGMSQDDILKEAQIVADQYVRKNMKKSIFSKIPAPAYTIAGAGITALIWMAVAFI